MHQSLQTEDHVGCQHDWIRIVFVVIDDEANNKDAATGVVVAAIPDDAANQMCQVLGDKNWWCDLCDRRGGDNVKCTEKHERAIWLLFYWYTKEQYDCRFKSFDDSSSNLLYLHKTETWTLISKKLGWLDFTSEES